MIRDEESRLEVRRRRQKNQKEIQKWDRRKKKDEYGEILEINIFIGRMF